MFGRGGRYSKHFLLVIYTVVSVHLRVLSSNACAPAFPCPCPCAFCFCIRAGHHQPRTSLLQPPPLSPTDTWQLLLTSGLLQAIAGFMQAQVAELKGMPTGRDREGEGDRRINTETGIHSGSMAAWGARAEEGDGGWRLQRTASLLEIIMACHFFARNKAKVRCGITAYIRLW